LRAQLTSLGRGKRPATDAASAGANIDDRSPIERGRAMTWVQRLKRVFGIDVKTCIHCGGSVRIVASIEEPKAIRAMPRPLRKARRDGASALPAGSARTARGGRVIAESAATPRRKPQPHPMRPRARSAALGPLSLTGGKLQRTALPNPHPPGEALSDDAPTTAEPTLATPLATAQTARKGRLNFLYSGATADHRVGRRDHASDAAAAGVT